MLLAYRKQYIGIMSNELPDVKGVLLQISQAALAACEVDTDLVIIQFQRSVRINFASLLPLISLKFCGAEGSKLRPSCTTSKPAG